MATPKFPEVPFNSKRIFTMGVASSGCKIYMPVSIDHPVYIEEKKQELQAYLDSQESYEPPPLELA